MHDIQSLLCPVDFNELSGEALKYAAFLAQRAHAPLMVLFAHPFLPPPYFDHAQMAAFRRQEAALKADAARRLRSFVIEHTDGSAAIEVEVKVAEAPAVDGILAAADEAGSTLLVMGTHGREGVERVMLGSVAERVLRRSRRPVLLLRHTPRPEIGRILCPATNSAISQSAFLWALSIARLFRASIDVLYVREGGPVDARPAPCDWAGPAARAGCAIRELSREGNTADEILAAANAAEVGLLVLGVRHRLFRDSTGIGVTAAHIVRHAPCPVLAVPGDVP